ncbi:Similar to RNaseZ: Ribonuclease Z [Cotesia congregata]|uniref:Zinc phosphodiesterase ELAC protein 2 n=1 Tax=Cotesia congregata TaxID=51543 RepID=A0A8J2HD67_COTCN|nr:Similar to RNaseZ: Ribonuclease Z [Cotesia congregata]
MYFKKIFNLLKTNNLPTKYINNCKHTKNNFIYFKQAFKRPESAPMSEKELNKSLQKIKQLQGAKKKVKYSPSTVTLQVLGSDARGATRCLYVSSDHSKYIFNCGEGTQRLAHENHLRLTKLDHIFFTTPTWQNIGGLPGLSLTIQDSGVSELTLHGPKGISEIYDAVKRFVYLTELNVTEASCEEKDVFQDLCMSVRYVHLKKSTPNNDPESNDKLDIDYSTDDNDDVDYYAHEHNKNGKRNYKIQNGKQPNSKIIKHEKKRVTRVTGCVAYICKLTDLVGSLNVEKCVDFGVPPGPLLGQLKSGKDITLENGNIVKSLDVVDPPSSGPVFIVLECPDEDYLQSLVNNEAFKNYQKNNDIQNEDDKNDLPRCIVHFTPENILRNPKYIDWMCKFPSETEHIIINDNNQCLNYIALHRIQHKLNLLHPEIFPIIQDEEQRVDTPYEEIDERLKDLKIHRGKTLNTFELRPLKGFKNSVIQINREADIKEAMDVDGFLDVLAELQTEINARSKFIESMDKFPKIVMLGTGSCVPNKVRNTSGILVRIDEETSILLDCGEGTKGQLVRFFGDESDNIIKSIKAIYISHLHADHHLGFLGVLQARKRLTDEKLFLLAPKQIESWIRLYHKKFEPFEDYINFVPNQGLLLTLESLPTDTKDELLQQLKLKKINTIGVLHCLHAFGISLTLKNERKIVYSGDTKPCPGLVTLGENCDLLIHEATMEDGLEHEARKKMHSTISQAISIGEQMKAKFILLTHFSQRYSKMPRIPEDDEKFNSNNIGIAFDNMQFNLAELTLLPLFYPALKLIFSEYCYQLETKAQRRLLKQQQQNEKLNLNIQHQKN